MSVLCVASWCIGLQTCKLVRYSSNDRRFGAEFEWSLLPLLVSALPVLSAGRNGLFLGCNFKCRHVVMSIKISMLIRRVLAEG